MTNCYLIHPKTDKLENSEYKLEELYELAKAIDLNIVGQDIINLKIINPGSFLGKGKLDELKNLFTELKVDLFIINSSLSPIQHRECEKILNIKILDRTALILEIFGERAKTNAGKLQVELAHLIYQKSRLVRSWTHLERQRGGGAFTGGPGERQIESDRRQIDNQINILKKKLKKVVNTRTEQRKNRLKAPYPTASLVGYTNTGKSTIFNKICSANVLAKDMLFATLDPSLRFIEFENREKIILSDTVGFISDLPTELIESFLATLEEVQLADIIIFVSDFSNPEYEDQYQTVIDVLKKINIHEDSEKTYIHIYNKIDKIEDNNIYVNLTKNGHITTKDEDNRLGSLANPYVIYCSAMQNINLENIKKTLFKIITSKYRKYKITLPANKNIGKAISAIKKNAVVINEEYEEDKYIYLIELSEHQINKIKKNFADICKIEVIN